MSPLEHIIRQEIAAKGDMPLERFMTLALSHPDHGYYMKQDPLGAKGDFTTAPEISQIFGELIGAWLLDSYHKLGAPEQVTLLECGAGRGTLLADALRVLQRDPAFKNAATLKILEISPELKDVQARTILPFSKAGWVIEWHSDLSEININETLLIIGNEILDALPIQQAIKTDQGWRQRSVTIQGESLTFAPTLEASRDLRTHAQRLAPEAMAGTIVEHAPAAHHFMSQILSLCDQAPSAAGLFIDYGYEIVGAGDTLQALHRHHPCSPLEHIGAADLTAHVNFAALKEQITSHPKNASFALTLQGAFLQNLGGDQRAMQLAQGAVNTQEGQNIINAYKRLMEPQHMGRLFKVMAFSQGSSCDFTGF